MSKEHSCGYSDDGIGHSCCEKVELLKNPDGFVEWQKICVCDFENNNNTHSLTCKSRWQKILDGKNE